jgi:hypothetical protein
MMAGRHACCLSDRRDADDLVEVLRMLQQFDLKGD